MSLGVFSRAHATPLCLSISWPLGLFVAFSLFRRLCAGLILLLLPKGGGLVQPFHLFPCPPAPDLGSRVSGLVNNGSSDTDMKGAQCYSSKNNISAARSVKHLNSHVTNHHKREIRSAEHRRCQYLTVCKIQIYFTCMKQF